MIEDIILFLFYFVFLLCSHPSLAGILGSHRIAKQAVFRLLLPLSSLGKWALTQLGGGGINP